MDDGNDQEGDADSRNIDSHGDSRGTGGTSSLAETRSEEESGKRNRGRGIGMREVGETWIRICW